MSQRDIDALLIGGAVIAFFLGYLPWWALIVFLFLLAKQQVDAERRSKKT